MSRANLSSLFMWNHLSIRLVAVGTVLATLGCSVPVDSTQAPSPSHSPVLDPEASPPDGPALDPQPRPMAVEDVQVPMTGKKGQPIEFVVTGIVPALCWEPDRVEAVVNEEVRSITLETTMRQVTAWCQPMVDFKDRSISFTPGSAGTYTLHANVVRSRSGQGWSAKETTFEIVVTE